MDEFVKKLYDFRVFIDFFGVKIVIGLSKNHCDLILTVGFDLSQNSRYLPIFYRYLPLFYRYLLIYLQYFFINSSTYVREIKSRNFIEISGISDISAIFSIFLRFFGQRTIGWQYRFGAPR